MRHCSNPEPIGLTARWVVPVAGPPVPGAVVVVEGRRIKEITSPENFARQYNTARLTSYGDALIVPGLVNLHTHLDYSKLRLFDVQSAFFDWIANLVQNARAWSKDDWRASAWQGVKEIALSGTSCIADCSFAGQAAWAVAKSGLRGVVGLEIFGHDTLCDHIFAQWLDKLEDVRKECADLAGGSREAEEEIFSRLTLTISPHAPYTVGPSLWSRALAWAKANDVPVLCHLAESSQEIRWIAKGDQEVDDFLSQFMPSYRRKDLSPSLGKGKTPVEYLAEQSLLNEHTVAAHAVELSDRDIELLARHKVKVAHCPRSNSRLRNGVARFADLLSAGVEVGLGTDSAASVDDLDLLHEALFALNLHRARQVDLKLTSAEMLYCLTLGAAKALRLDSLIGSIEPGKLADLAVFRIDPRAERAMDRPEDLLIYNEVYLEDLLVNGCQVVKQGKIQAR